VDTDCVIVLTKPGTTGHQNPAPKEAKGGAFSLVKLGPFQERENKK